MYILLFSPVRKNSHSCFALFYSYNSWDFTISHYKWFTCTNPERFIYYAPYSLNRFHNHKYHEVPLAKWKDFLLFCLERQAGVGDRVKNYTFLRHGVMNTNLFIKPILSSSWRFKGLNLEASPLCTHDRNVRWEWWVYETCHSQAVLWAIYINSNRIGILSW